MRSELDLFASSVIEFRIHLSEAAMRFRRAVLFAAVVFPSTLLAQQSDSLRMGDRVRVTVAATRGNTNVFIGNVDRVTPDTLFIGLPGGKGLITLPRLAVSEVSISDGRESRWSNLPRVAPLLVPTAMILSMPTPKTPHWAGLRNQRYALVGLSIGLASMRIAKTQPERWKPVYGWLHQR
jgi:hypothetical protein